MLSWLLNILGISDSLAQRVDEAELVCARPGVMIAGLILLVPLAVLIVWRHRRGMPHIGSLLRGLLTACRLGVLLLLVFVLSGPYLRLVEPITQKPILALVVDESASMDLPAGTYQGSQLARLAGALELAAAPDDGGLPKVTPQIRKELTAATRGELLRRIFDKQRDGIIDPLSERMEIRTYRFARDTREAALPADEESDTPVGVDRGDSALGAAIQQVLADVAGRDLSGIVLFTDGRSTTGPDPLSVAQTADILSGEDDGAPIVTVPVGSGAAMADIALLDVLAPAQVARGDTSAVVATVGSSGFDNRRVKVKLTEGDRVHDEAELLLRGDERQQVSLAFPAEQPGTHLLTVTVAENTEELVQANNQQGVSIQVDEDQWKLLYLEGYPRWDFRFLDHALRRDHGLETTIVMEARLRAEGVKEEDLPTAARLPQDAAGFAEYNVVILGDISPGLLPPRLQKQLAMAVEQDGLGLIVQAGTRYMPHVYADGPLADVLPLTVTEGDGIREDDQPGRAAPAFAPFRMEVTANGSLHPAFRLYDSATKNRGVWSRMPVFYWAMAAADEPAAGATVLAKVKTAGAEHPLIAEHFAGRGRVLLLGGDSTYRWRRNIGDHLFYRFWGQALRHVARRKERSGDTSWMAVYPTRVEPGENVAIELYSTNARGEPTTGSRASVRVIQDTSEETVTLDRAEQAGHYRGMWKATASGDYRITHTDVRGTPINAAVRVAPSGRELLRPDVDRDTLGSLADATGGALLELGELDRLPQHLHGEAITVQRTHEDEVWDNWLTLLLLVALYCTDVFIRRMTGLT